MMAKDNYLSSVEEATDQLICTGYPQKLYLYLLSGPEPLFTLFAITPCRRHQWEREVCCS